MTLFTIGVALLLLAVVLYLVLLATLDSGGEEVIPWMAGSAIFGALCFFVGVAQLVMEKM